MAISENDSIEELYKNMQENPMYGLLNTEIYSLADAGESMNHSRKSQEGGCCVEVS